MNNEIDKYEERLRIEQTRLWLKLEDLIPVELKDRLTRVYLLGKIQGLKQARDLYLDKLNKEHCNESNRIFTLEESSTINSSRN